MRRDLARGGAGGPPLGGTPVGVEVGGTLPWNFYQKNGVWNIIPRMAKERGRCIVDGCENLQMFKDWASGGVRRWCPRCAKHTRAYRLKAPIDGVPCSKCGWRGQCERHRIVKGSDGGVYTASNIQVLCPNCHRAADGRGSWNQPQSYDS